MTVKSIMFTAFFVFNLAYYVREYTNYVKAKEWRTWPFCVAVVEIILNLFGIIIYTQPLIM